MMRPYYKDPRILVPFVLRKVIRGFDIPSTPMFESEEATNWFSGLLKRSRCYIEFGAGGSTLLAAKMGLRFSTVESDRRFLEAVKLEIERQGCLDRNSQHYRWIDIGFTGPAGFPVTYFPVGEKRLNSYRTYSDLPAVPGDPALKPDLILIDGRFRVACALKAIRALRETSGWTMIIDDYENRLPRYGLIESFALKTEVHGRMAAFTKRECISDIGLAAAISRFETIAE